MQRSGEQGADSGGTSTLPLLSVVVPIYNEQEVVRSFQQRLTVILDRFSEETEIIYVNDGSTDGTLAVLHELRAHDPRVAILDLSRNFGKEIAMSAGLEHARGEAVVIIDADLQDPPEVIPEFVGEWRNGYDVVYGRRSAREGESCLKKLTAFGFYRLIEAVSRVKIPADTGDFRLLSRRAVESLGLFREQHRFMKGLYSWIGYPQKEVLYRRDPGIQCFEVCLQKASVTDDRCGPFLEQQVNVARGHEELTMRNIRKLSGSSMLAGRNQIGPLNDRRLARKETRGNYAQEVLQLPRVGRRDVYPLRRSLAK